MTLSLPLAARPPFFAATNIELTRTILRAVEGRDENPQLATLLSDSLAAIADSLCVPISPTGIERATSLGLRLASDGRLPRLTRTRAEVLLLEPSLATRWPRLSRRALMWELERRIASRPWALTNRERRPKSAITAGLIVGRTINQISADSSGWLEPHAIVSPDVIAFMRGAVEAWLGTLHLSAVESVFMSGSELRRLAIPKVIWSFLPEDARRLVSEAHEAIADGRAVAPARWDVLSPAARQVLHHALLLGYIENLSLAIDEIAKQA